jgi:hypothetical protein
LLTPRAHRTRAIATCGCRGNWKLKYGLRTCQRAARFELANALYFRGLPRFAKINPRASAVHRSWLADLRASLRSGPGGSNRASSKASAARLSQSSLSGERRVSLPIALQSSRCLDFVRFFDSKTLASVTLFPPLDGKFAGVTRACEGTHGRSRQQILFQKRSANAAQLAASPPRSTEHMTFRDSETHARV